jgi:hypothetical protein
MNPSDLTGRDLDLAVTKRLGYVWWHSPTIVEMRRPDSPPPESWGCTRVEDPGSCDLPGYDCNPAHIPELFAEIRKRTGGWVQLMAITAPAPGYEFLATTIRGASYGSTPSEALARLLLMVGGGDDVSSRKA